MIMEQVVTVSPQKVARQTEDSVVVDPAMTEPANLISILRRHCGIFGSTEDISSYPEAAEFCCVDLDKLFESAQNRAEIPGAQPE